MLLPLSPFFYSANDISSLKFFFYWLEPRNDTTEWIEKSFFKDVIFISSSNNINYDSIHRRTPPSSEYAGFPRHKHIYSVIYGHPRHGKILFLCLIHWKYQNNMKEFLLLWAENESRWARTLWRERRNLNGGKKFSFLIN